MRLFHHINLFFLCLLGSVFGFGYDYSVVVPGGRKECYYQPVTSTEGITAEFEYQVLDQSPVNFHVRSPKNVYLVGDVKKTHSIHPLHLKETGIYEVCITNTYFTTPKTVYLGIYSDTPDSTWPFTHMNEEDDKIEEAEAIMEVSAGEISTDCRWCLGCLFHFCFTLSVLLEVFGYKSIEGLQIQAEKMRFLQTSIRSSNMKDYIVQRSNSFRVNTFSGAQLLIMVAAGIVQVFTIRKLFGNDTDKVHNMKMAT